MRHFLQGRIDFVQTLRNSSLDVTPHDLHLILTAVMSACAACRWPGDGFDRKRFVESLIRFSSPGFHLDYISTRCWPVVFPLAPFGTIASLSSERNAVNKSSPLTMNLSSEMRAIWHRCAWPGLTKRWSRPLAYAEIVDVNAAAEC